MKYWLMKSEPDTFSIDHLINSPRQSTEWEGVRNYQARNFMRDEMKLGDKAFFYHSNCEQPGIVGIMEIIKESHPDLSAFDPKSPYYDSKSSHSNPRWSLVSVRFIEKFKQTITLHALKIHPKLTHMRVIQPGNRLSITPVTKQEWDIILKLKE